MSSQSSNLHFHSNVLPALTVQSDIASMPAAALAQLVDCLSQDYRLSAPSCQKLQWFAVQTNPLVDALWTYALTLSHNEMFKHILGRFGDICQGLTNLTNLVHHEWQLSKSQQDVIKHSQRVFITQSKTSYCDLAKHTKEYLFHHSVQFSLPMYTTNKAVKTSVNKMVEKDAHQLTLPQIYTATVGSCHWNQVANEIDSLYSMQTGDKPLPVYFKAQIASLYIGMVQCLSVTN
ncbi:hypothetical protein FS749_011315 [Ceratobasidium sp. UAMH 11750]|nr:hypothetical protein FS749_011315 [Ceratobasidium sp. UAMH 11750]